MRWLGLDRKWEGALAGAGEAPVAPDAFLFALRRFFKSTPVFLVFGFLFIYLEMISPSIYPHYNGRLASGFVFATFASWVCFFTLPALYAKLFFQESPRSFGLRMPADRLRAFYWFFVGFVTLEPFFIYFSRLANFHQYYANTIHWPQLLLLNVLVFPLQYFAEEFFFRGFLFIGIWRKCRWHSFWITDVLFTFSHIGKPGLEILLCIPASVVFNVLTLKSQSIYPAIILHSCLGITLCLMINL